MENYIIDRLRADSDHVLNLFKNEGKIPHTLVKGRTREILINNLLQPWLPPGVKCGTGIVIDANNLVKGSGQEDIVLFDESLCPPVLASANTPDGVFLYNSVFARVEVKSKLTRNYVRNFISSSLEYMKFQVTVRPECKRKFTGAVNLLFAYESDQKNENDNEYFRLMSVFEELKIDPISGIVSMLCVPGYGFYKIGSENNSRAWQKLDTKEAVNHIAWFIGCISSTCFEMRIERQGREKDDSIEGGIDYFMHSPYVTI